MKSSFFIIAVSISLNSLAHAQMPPSLLNQPQQSQAISGKKLENLLLCTPARKFTRASAKTPFELGLVEDKSGIYHPSNGKNATVFGADIADATISDESDESRLSVRVLDRTPDDIAKLLNIKKQRVKWPIRAGDGISQANQ